MIGDGGVFTSIEDLARWDANFYEPRVGTKATLKRMLTPGALNDGEALEYASGLTVSDYHGLRKVSEGITAAVATGENLDDISEFTPLIANGAVDIVQVGSSGTGITGAMMVADLAYAFELPIAVMNCPANYMAHMAAALPNHMMMEVVAVGRDIAMQVDQTMEDGWIVLGDSPGLGGRLTRS